MQSSFVHSDGEQAHPSATLGGRNELYPSGLSTQYKGNDDHQDRDQYRDHTRRDWLCVSNVDYEESKDSQPSKLAGTTIARIVLSALADTRRFAEGLNRSAVGGKEWAARILRSGYSNGHQSHLDNGQIQNGQQGFVHQESQLISLNIRKTAACHPCLIPNQP